MIRRRLNSTIYTGRVGAKMRPRVIRGWHRRIVKVKMKLVGGPWSGHAIWLDGDGDGRTLPLVIGGVAGVYNKGVWQQC